MEYFNTEKQQEKKRKKAKSIVCISHNRGFSRRGKIGITFPAFVYPFSPSLHIKHLAMLNELFLVLEHISYANCLAENGRRGVTCAVSAGAAVISCGSVSDICAQKYEQTFKGFFRVAGGGGGSES